MHRHAANSRRRTHLHLYRRNARQQLLGHANGQHRSCDKRRHGNPGWVLHRRGKPLYYRQPEHGKSEFQPYGRSEVQNRLLFGNFDIYDQRDLKTFLEMNR